MAESSTSTRRVIQVSEESIAEIQERKRLRLNLRKLNETISKKDLSDIESFNEIREKYSVIFKEVSKPRLVM